MAIQWSKEQLQAINTVDHNILVSASAGAGKTTVLVERLMKRMLHDHISIDRIVAMTFTEAAASEMKKRLLQSLNKKLEEEDLSEQEAEYCRQQLILLQSAHISTIHSFCLSIIKSDYALIGLNPARISNIFDDATVSLLKQKAFLQASRSLMSKDPQRFTSLLNFFSSRSENFDELQKAVSKISAQAMGTHDPIRYLNRSLQAYSGIRHIEDLPEPLCSLFFDYCHTEALRMENYAKNLQDILFRNYPDKEKQAAEVTLFLDKLHVAVKAAEQHDYREYHRALFNALQSKISIIQKAPDYSDARKEINKLSKELAENTYDEETLLHDLAETYQVMEPLIELTELYMDQYAGLKNEMEGIDFDDMEHFAYQILCAENGVAARKYQEHFDEIMVDEFQDSNDLQNEIICRISRGNNVFRVGDIKQSIYRFRGAKPQIMRDLSNDDSEENCFIHLSNNFRSKAMIVDFNNTLFTSLMNIQGCSDRYTEHDNVVTGVPEQKEDNYPVEFHALNMPDLKEELQAKSLSSSSLKADYIAQQILYQHENSKFRQWKDYVVLVRSHNVKQHLKKAFDDAGIPYFIDAKAGFYQSESIQVLLSWFRILVDSRDNLSLSAVLTSDFYQTSDEELATLFLQKEKTECLFDVLTRIGHPLVNDYFQCRKISHDQGLCALIDQLMLVNDFYEKRCNAQQRTNCDLLRSKAEQFSLTYSDSLTAFLTQVDQVSDEKTSEAIPVGNEDDVVKVMTIHQSKGLQFPVVFYWASSRIDVLDRKELCIADSELGVGIPCITMPMRYQRPTAIRYAIEHKITLDELEENIRILYVALTRAQNKMILVDTVKGLPDKNKVTINTLLDRKGTTDLILTAMNAFHVPYYKVTEISSPWPKEQFRKEEKKIVDMPRYTLPNYPIRTLTPSTAAEEQSEIRSLNLQRSGMSGAMRGTRLHEAVEQLPDTPWDPSLITQKIPGIYDYEVDLLMKLDQQPLFRQIRDYDVRKEFSFAALIKDQLIHGQMDYVSFHDHEIWLVDFKSDRDTTSSELSETYAQQISCYIAALNQIHPDAQIHAYLYSFTLDEFIPMN